MSTEESAYQPLLFDRLSETYRTRLGQNGVDTASVLRSMLLGRDFNDELVDRVHAVLIRSNTPSHSVSRIMSRIRGEVRSGKIGSTQSLSAVLDAELRKQVEVAVSPQRIAQLLKESVEAEVGKILRTRIRIKSELLDAYPNVASSVLQYGLPDISGTIARTWTRQSLESMIREAILRHEPRILAETLMVVVRAEGIEHASDGPGAQTDEQRDLGWILRNYVCEVRGVLRTLQARMEIWVVAQMGSGATS